MAGPAGGAGEDRRAPPPRRAPTARAGRQGRGCPARPRSAPPSPSPSSSGIRQSRPITSPPAARHRRRAASTCRCRSGSSARRPRRGSAPTTARRTPRSRRARARRPTSRTAAPRRRRRAPAPRRTSAKQSRRASSSSACQTSGSRVHQRLDRRELARRLAFDEVAGDRERPAAEADDGLLGRELGAHDANRLEQRRERLVGLGHAQPLDVGQRADRLGDHRADALDELDVEPHAEHRGHDVREHHGRVDAVAAHGLQRHLGAELGRVRDLPERVLLADRAVLGQRPARPGA